MNLCTQYYDLDKHEPSEDELSFYLQYAEGLGGKILEPMCGSGRLFVPMMEHGLDIEGFDASEFMLESLYRKCNEKKLEPKVWQNFTHKLEKKNTYNLVIIPVGSLSLITDSNQLKISLEQIRESLVDGGVFVFELLTMIILEGRKTNRWGESSRTTPDGSKIILSCMDLPVENNIGESICRYEMVVDNQIQHTEIETYELRYFEKNEIDFLLNEIGFSKINHVTNCKHANSNECMVYECHK